MRILFWPKHLRLILLWRIINHSYPLNSDSAQSTPIKILRGIGACHSLVLANTLSFSEKTSSGTSVLINCVECGFVKVPLHNIYLSSDLVTGLVAVGIRKSVSMVRKYHNHKQHTNPRNREEEPLNLCSKKTSKRQLKQCFQRKTMSLQPQNEPAYMLTALYCVTMIHAESHQSFH